jgi:DNA-binding beta-propeller fold protein YncE
MERLWSLAGAITDNGGKRDDGENPKIPPRFNGILYSRDGSVWVASSEAGQVSRINAGSQTLHGAAIKVGDFPADLAMLRGELWILNFGDGSLSRVDPLTATLVGEPVGLPASRHRITRATGRAGGVSQRLRRRGSRLGRR